MSHAVDWIFRLWKYHQFADRMLLLQSARSWFFSVGGGLSPKIERLDWRHFDRQLGWVGRQRTILVYCDLQFSVWKQLLNKHQVLPALLQVVELGTQLL